MQRIKVAVIGTNACVEWAILPALRGGDAISPPDTGAWWSRRPTPAGDIRFVPPALPEVVALCDWPAPRAEKKTRTPLAVSPRLESLGRAFGVSALYAEPLQLLREQPLDAVFLAQSGEFLPVQLASLVAANPGAQNGVSAPRWLWIDGPPARSIRDLNAFAILTAAPRPALWMAAALRRAAAHRAAKRLIERDAIGAVTALNARFPFPFDAARFDSLFSAFDLLFGFVPVEQLPREVFAVKHGDGATALLLRFATGVPLSVLFCGADTWNCGLPRLEICGTQGRFLVCEGARRLWHHVPREGARLWEPPGLAPHLSGANLSGYAEDIKAFLGVCADNPVPWSAERALDEAARALGAIEATFLSLQSGTPAPITPRGLTTRAETPFNGENTVPKTRNLTLDLQVEN